MPMEIKALFRLHCKYMGGGKNPVRSVAKFWSGKSWREGLLFFVLTAKNRPF